MNKDESSIYHKVQKYVTSGKGFILVHDLQFHAAGNICYNGAFIYKNSDGAGVWHRECI